MLEFFRKYQKFFFVLVTFLVIASFSFFGAFGAFTEEVKREDPVIGEALDGSSMKFSEIHLLSRFLDPEGENLCDDGIVFRDLLHTGLADLLVAAYFDPLKGDFQSRLERAKQFRPYVHPQAPFLSASSVWDHLIPSLNEEIQALQEEVEASPKTFCRLSKIYQQQRFLPPEVLRRILWSQAQQLGSLDPRLQHEDLSLFGFHTLSDWFGPHFADLAAAFILNASRMAEKRGFQVSLEEAKGDLFCNFERALERISKGGKRIELSLAHHLRSLGFDEKSAVQCWRNILLFRRYFQGMGEAVFIDRLPYRDFASYALEKAVIDLYSWPEALSLKSESDLLEFEAYLRAISPEKSALALPAKFYSLDEIEEKECTLISTSYRARVREISKTEVALRAPLQEIWEWQLENWGDLRKAFPFLSSEETERSSRFTALDSLRPDQRIQIDRYARKCLLERHPEWIEEALLARPLEEKVLSISLGRSPLPELRDPKALAHLLEGAAQGNEEAKKALFYCGDGEVIYRIEGVEKIGERHLLTFAEAKELGILPMLSKRLLEREYPKVQKKEEATLLYLQPIFRAIEAQEKEKLTPSQCAQRRLIGVAREALRALEKNPTDEQWVQGKEEPWKEQFKLVRIEREIQRTDKEDWMKEQAFIIPIQQWSPIRVSEEGKVAFFFLKEKKIPEVPILDQLYFGKELVSADTKRYLAERLLHAAKKRRAIVIPLERRSDESV